MHQRREQAILVVDRESDDLDLFERTLGFDYRVYRATDTEEALAIVAATPSLAVIVTDRRLPRLTSAPFAVESRRRPPSPIRVILSGFAEPADLIDAINSPNVYRYLAKPWRVDELRAAVAHAAQLFGAGGGELIDEITGLPNGKLLRLELEREMARAERSTHPASVVALSLVEYPTYQELAGPPAGERLLRSVAGQLQSQVRRMDFVGVAAEHQFVVLLPECPPTEMIATRLQNALCDNAVFQRAVQEHAGLRVRMASVRCPEQARTVDAVWTALVLDRM